MSKRKPARQPTAGAPARSGAPARPRGPGQARRQAQPQRRWIGRAALGLGLVAAIAIVVAVTAAHSTKSPSATGQAAPDGSFTTTTGRTETVSALRGQPTLLWFVATWCSSCQAGTTAMAQQISNFAAHHVRVVELEMADDLGQSGPPITEFGQQLAGLAYHNPDWTWGVASSALTQTYNPNGYLDIYYLLDRQGRIAYVNGSPGATMGQLLAEVAKVGSQA
jgi:thiol-disulfide isomerase/thioredoxin